MKDLCRVRFNRTNLFVSAIMAVFFVGCGAGTSVPVKKVEAGNLFTGTKVPAPEKTEAILKLDTLGHTAMIRDVIITKNQKIITASDDKTIRIWNLEGKEERKILGQIGKGNEGKIFAIALSPDERYLAVGGYLGSYTGKKAREDEEAHKIRIYSYQSGKLLKVLKSHTNVVHDLSFSKDGKYLISGSGDKTAKIWNTNGFKLIDTIKFHSKQVYAVKIIKKGGIYFAVTAGYDNKIAIYNLKTKRVVKSHQKNYKLHSIAVSKNQIAVRGKGKEIGIYDYDLNLVKNISSDTIPSGLAYSPNGKYLIAGAGTSPRNVNIYQTSNYQKISTFSKHTNLTIAVGFIDNQRAISCGGGNKEIYIWDIKSAKVAKKMVGVGESVWSVGVKGDKIAWGNKWTATKGKSELQKSLNLKTMQLGRGLQSPNHGLKSMPLKNGNLSLTHQKGGDYGRSDAVLVLKSNDKVKTKITRGSTNGMRHRCYGFYKNFIISGGSGGFLKIYNLEGKEVANLVGHTGEVWSIAVDGDRLVSGSNDQTIKVWDLNFLGAGTSVPVSSRTKVLAPTLNIFVAKNNEWVVWTKEGFFDASENGAKYIGYHLNHGSNKEAEFISVDKLYSSFYKPKLIQKALAGEDLSQYADEINIDKILSDGLSPVVELLTKDSTIRGDSTEIRLKITNRGGELGEIKIYRRGELIMNKTKAVRVREQGVHKFRVALNEGENQFKIVATNRANGMESDSQFLTIHAKTSYHHAKPKLFVLSVGIKEFRKPSLSLLYPVEDAKHLVATLQKHSRGLFEKIEVTLLTTKEQTSKKSIEEAFRKIAKQIRPLDFFLVNFSSHGENISINKSTNRYYLFTSDVRFTDKANLDKTALSEDELTNLLAMVDAKQKILVLDTCYAGAGAENIRFKSAGDETNMKLLQRAIGSSLFASSSSKEKSMDGYKGHGIFTYFLTKGLEGKSDQNGDGVVNINELKSYTENAVYDKAHEKGFEQSPYIRINSRNFPISQK